MTQSDIQQKFKEELYTDQYVNQTFTDIVGEKIYEPWDCLSAAFYKIIIPRHRFAILCRIHGVNRKGDVIFINDAGAYKSKTQKRKLYQSEVDMCQISMEIWGAKKCIYHVVQAGRSFPVDADPARMQYIGKELQKFAEKYISTVGELGVVGATETVTQNH
jgi:hypothetical protein